jgi:hypothetical protein
MDNTLPGSTTGLRILDLALRLSDEKWHRIGACAEYVEGLLHKLEFAGIETRSGEAFGITAKLHVVSDIRFGGGTTHGRITELVIEQGRTISTRVVSEREEIIL